MDDGSRGSKNRLVTDETGRSRGGGVELSGGGGAECDSRLGGGGGGGQELRSKAAVNV